MERKDFIKKSIFSFGTIVGLPLAIQSYNKDAKKNKILDGDCKVTPSETKGPFPIKTPSELVRENIISDRQGVALLVTITIQDTNCKPLSGALVDIWHCDKNGHYSEYGGMRMQATDYTDVHFLRGRQTTNAAGQVSFISIYPGWYRGRAPHIHVEVLGSNKSSLLVSQIAFPENISSEVYASSLYASHGQADTLNANDNVFSDGVDDEMGEVTGNLKDGYAMSHTITVNN